MKKLILPVFGLLLTSQVFSQTAKLQIIHNSSSSAASVVDVYAGSDKLIDNFAFRSATEYLTVPAGVAIRIGIAPEASNSVMDTIAGLGQTITLLADKEYVGIASGLVGSTTTPFTIIAFEGKSSTMATTPATTSVAIHHGSADAPRVDIVARGVGTLATASYGETAPYLEVPSIRYILDVKPAGSSTIVASYEADLTVAPNTPLVAFASGLLGGMPAFGLYVATPNGTVLPLVAVSKANVQIIHNCPSAAASLVDLYAGSARLLDDFAFRTATPFLEVDADLDIRLGVALGSSNSVTDTLAGLGQTVRFENGKEYVAIASGIVGSITTPFRIVAFEGKSSVMATTPTTTSVTIHHGSPDAPRVDIVARGVGTLATASFGETAPYQAVPSIKYILDVKPAGSSAIVASYDADLTIAPNTPLVAFASGLLTPTSTETAAFGLFAATPTGAVITLPISLTSGLFEGSLIKESMQLFPNPASTHVTFNNKGITELTVMNCKGQIVLSYLNNIPSEIDLSGLESGFYTFKINRDGDLSASKLVLIK